MNGGVSRCMGTTDGRYMSGVEMSSGRVTPSGAATSFHASATKHDCQSCIRLHLAQRVKQLGFVSVPCR